MAFERYEFRCWPQDPEPAARALRETWTEIGQEAREDLYLLTPLNDRFLIKLRGGSRFEIKTLLGRKGDLDYWDLTVSEEFPLTEDALTAVPKAFGLSHALSAGAGESVPQFLGALRAADAPARRVSVPKQRRKFRGGTSIVELTAVRVPGLPDTTIAVEDPDAASAWAAVKSLGLQTCNNRHYGLMLTAAFGT